MVFGTYALDYYKDKMGTIESQGKLFNEMVSGFTSRQEFRRALRLRPGLAWPGPSTRHAQGPLPASVKTALQPSPSAPSPKLAQIAAWDPILGY